MFAGTGLQNLRECIVWTKQKFDFEPKVKKPFWKRMSVNFIERYCYLICFATYLKEEAPKGNISSFKESKLHIAICRQVL